MLSDGSTTDRSLAKEHSVGSCNRIGLSVAAKPKRSHEKRVNRSSDMQNW